MAGVFFLDLLFLAFTSHPETVYSGCRSAPAKTPPLLCSRQPSADNLQSHAFERESVALLYLLNGTGVTTGVQERSCHRCPTLPLLSEAAHERPPAPFEKAFHIAKSRFFKPRQLVFQ